MDRRPPIVLVTGSTRVGSTNTAALRVVAEHLGDDAVLLDRDALVALPAFDPDPDLAAPEAVASLWAHLDAAALVVLCTPEYAGALPGSVKNLLDWTVGAGSLVAKPVAWLAVAAPGRGLGAEAELRTVLGYVDAAVDEALCRRIEVRRDAVADGEVTDAATRAALAAYAEQLRRRLPGAP